MGLIITWPLKSSGLPSGEYEKCNMSACLEKGHRARRDIAVDRTPGGSERESWHAGETRIQRVVRLTPNRRNSFKEQSCTNCPDCNCRRSNSVNLFDARRTPDERKMRSASQKERRSSAKRQSEERSARHKRHLEDYNEYDGQLRRAEKHSSTYNPAVRAKYYKTKKLVSLFHILLS